jgi:hypothetical protein
MEDDLKIFENGRRPYFSTEDFKKYRKNNAT